MTTCLRAASAALLLSPVPAMAQGMDHQHMPGMTMPMPAKPTPEKKPAPAKKAKPRSPAKAGAQSQGDHGEGQPAVASDMASGPRPSPGNSVAIPDPGAPAGTTDHTMPMPADPAATPPAPAAPIDHMAMGHAGMSGTMTMPAMMSMIGGDSYTLGSGTSRLPAREGMMRGIMVHSGDWMLMLHGYAWGAYTDQGGPRGDSKAFVQSMAMVMAQRPLGDGARLQLQTMLSLEPLMGPRGYPNLLATGETANGRALIDRQHPHDLFMELSGRIDVDVAQDSSLFLYGGPVGEPALGPSAFMHRKSAQYLPLAPITHHWFDSTHITYGVVTLGYAVPTFQIEASAFRGREPDEHRWNIETPKLDSWSVRGTWTPVPALAVQVSYGWLKSPEELEPDSNERRTTASVNYATGKLTTTFAFSNKDKGPGRKLTAWLGEANVDLDPHNSLFGRVENVANDELFPDHADPLHDRRFRVTKIEGGYARRVGLVGPTSVALGGTVGTYVLPDALHGAYGRMPVSFTLFAKVMLGR